MAGNTSNTWQRKERKKGKTVRLESVLFLSSISVWAAKDAMPRALESAVRSRTYTKETNYL